MRALVLTGEDALATCQQEFHRRQQQNVAAHLPGDTCRGLRVGTAFRDVNSDLVLLPVYLLTYRYGERLFRFLINGQTGKVAGQKPWSWRRIALAVGAGLATILVVVLLVFLLGLSR